MRGRAQGIRLGFGALSFALALSTSVLAAGQGQPNFSGSWVRRGPVVDVNTAPPLTPAGKAQFEINKAGIEASDPKVDLILQCLPAGFPRSLEGGQPFYITQTSEALSWLGASGGRPQMVYMTDKHLKLWPFWMGDSIGHWEGDTLVVEVTDIITKTFLHDDGLPHSDVLRVVERLRLIEGGKALENRVRMEDPKILTKPWEFTVVYDRTDEKPVESVCENTRLR
jgi:hypothetical protein